MSEQYKAWLVILGNAQKEGIDFTKTFAPAAKMVIVYTLLFVASTWKWPVHQMDVHNTFLHSDLTKEVYKRPPPCFHHSFPG